MGQNVIGLDLGSHAVKAVALRLGLRGSEIAVAGTEPVRLAENGASTDAEVFAAAGRLLARLKLDTESMHCAVPGDAATIRLVRLPTGAARRVEQVLRFELDEALPFDIEDAVFDWVEQGRSAEGMSLLTAVVRKERVKAIVDGLSSTGFDPREIGVAALAYGADFDNKEDAEPCAVIDCGHTRTNVFIAGDKVASSRTILRGGRDLTLRLAEAGHLAFELAEANKHHEGLTGRVGQILAESMKPLLREIRNTLAGHVAAGGKRVRRIFLCGGTSLLKGFDQLLANELGVQVERYGVKLDGAAAREGIVAPEALVLAHALARRESLDRSKRLNLRRGELTFKGDYAFVRRRVIMAAAFVLAVIGAWIFSSYAEYRVLADAATAQEERLRRESLRFFGTALVERTEIEKLVGGTKSAVAPVPVRDAFDILVELSKRIPTTVVHDIELLDIKPKRITIRALVDSELKAAGGEGGAGDVSSEEMDDVGDGDAEGEELQLSPTDLIQQKLSEFKECFTAIRIGKVQTHGARRSYQMDIESKCP
jgi:general secretion pathway protein L